MNIRCPNCNTTLRAPDDSAGKRFRCPKCSNVLTVPAAEPTVPEVPSMPPAPAPSVPQAAPTPLPPQPPETQFPPQPFTEQQPYQQQQQVPQQQFQQPAVSTDPYAVGGATGMGYGYDAGKAQKGTSDIGWHSVEIGFRISSISLLITAIGLTLLLLVTLIGISGGGRGGSGAIMANIGFWGGAAVIGAFFAMLAGWFVCLAVPRNSDANGLAIGSVICICIAIGTLIIIAPALGTMFGMGSSRSFRSAQALAQIIQWLMLISGTAGFALFGFFAAKVAQSFQDRSVNTIALANALVQGGMLMWFIILQVGLRARSAESAIMILVVTFLLMIASQVMLMFAVHKSRRIITRVRPW